MGHRFSRTEMIIGSEGLDILATSTVAIFGIGGVGGYAAEALARSGIGTLVLVDHDQVSVSNINRQIIALETTIGLPKVEVMAQRISQINPSCKVIPRQEFYDSSKAHRLLLNTYDYVVDAIDSVGPKVDLIYRCVQENIAIISAMGAGNKLDPTQFTVSDISKTHTCPLARTVRTALRKRGIEKGVKVVFSAESPIRRSKTVVPGSTAFVPPTAGLIMASVVVQDILARRAPNEPI
ncbi:MAG: tRNA threonylcarbamoyladenosine dehydratase [Firmicutes bacterium]|nr:tRNA threonylcarbamoyladenosine dehydratase [Bacillota bacterium]